MKPHHRLLTISLIYLCLASGAQAETVVIVHAKNATAALTLDQVQSLFLGKLRTFPNGSEAVPLDQTENPEREAFYLTIAGRDSQQMKAYWSRRVFASKGFPPQAIANPQEIVRRVASNPEQIAYVDRRWASPEVRVVFSLAAPP